MVQGARPWGWHADRVGQEAGPFTALARGDFTEGAVTSLALVTHTDHTFTDHTFTDHTFTAHTRMPAGAARAAVADTAGAAVTATAGTATADRGTDDTGTATGDTGTGAGDDGTGPGTDARAVGGAGLSAALVGVVRELLVGARVPGSPAGRVEVLRGLEELKASIAGVQARVALELDASTRAAEADAGVRADRLGRAVPQEVGLAVRRSPFAARAFLGAARVWATEMPHTLAALTAGWLTEERAVLLVRETACLPLDARREIDARLCADPRVLDGVGTVELGGRVRKLAAELDPAAVVARARRAEGERRVSIRPAPDTMTYVTALLPVAQGVAVYGALKAGAATPVDTEDVRSVGQRMADLLVTRTTGQATAGAVPVTVNLVVSDQALLGAGHEAGVVLDQAGQGHGPVPAQVARNVIAAGLDTGAAWLRTLYADPAGRLITATSRRRFYADGLADLLRVRDQGICRTPYCGAPARHLDHITPHATGGATTLDNGQGLCQACNQAKESPGWTHEPGSDPVTGRHQVSITTPTGHRYLSTAPPPPAPVRRAVATTTAPPVESDPAWGDSPLERAFAHLVDHYHAA